jgi:ferredoxin
MPPDRDDLVHVRIDENICIGIGVCVESEPEAFLLGDDGVAHVLPGKALPRHRAERVCGGCPSGAISIVEVNGAGTVGEEPS